MTAFLLATVRNFVTMDSRLRSRAAGSFRIWGTKQTFRPVAVGRLDLLNCRLETNVFIQSPGKKIDYILNRIMYQES